MKSSTICMLLLFAQIHHKFREKSKMAQQAESAPALKNEAKEDLLAKINTSFLLKGYKRWLEEPLETCAFAKKDGFKAVIEKPINKRSGFNFEKVEASEFHSRNTDLKFTLKEASNSLSLSSVATWSSEVKSSDIVLIVVTETPVARIQVPNSSPFIESLEPLNVVDFLTRFGDYYVESYDVSVRTELLLCVSSTSNEFITDLATDITASGNALATASGSVKRKTKDAFKKEHVKIALNSSRRKKPNSSNLDDILKFVFEDPSENEKIDYHYQFNVAPYHRLQSFNLTSKDLTAFHVRDGFLYGDSLEGDGAVKKLRLLEWLKHRNESVLGILKRYRLEKNAAAIRVIEDDLRVFQTDIQNILAWTKEFSWNSFTNSTPILHFELRPRGHPVIDYIPKREVPTGELDLVRGGDMNTIDTDDLELFFKERNELLGVELRRDFWFRPLVVKAIYKKPQAVKKRFKWIWSRPLRVGHYVKIDSDSTIQLILCNGDHHVYIWPDDVLSISHPKRKKIMLELGSATTFKFVEDDKVLVGVFFQRTTLKTRFGLIFACLDVFWEDDKARVDRESDLKNAEDALGLNVPEPPAANNDNNIS